MKLEIFPYRFRGKANAGALRRRSSYVIELKGARALYDLYMSGASFRIMPDSPIDAVVFDLNRLTMDDTAKLDRYVADNAFVVKSPSAVLKIPGKENRRKVFYELSQEYTYAEYREAYCNAFIRFTIEAGLGAIAYDTCMRPPREMTFGRPDPDMLGPFKKVDVKNLGVIRIPMPLSRSDTKELFGIDERVSLPSIEYFFNGKVEEGERYTFIWKKIIPAAFAWYHFFETSTEERWGLADNHFEFNDCVSAIEREISRLGVPREDVEEVIQGNLYAAYRHFKAPQRTPYLPRTGEVKSVYWDGLTPKRKKEIYERHNVVAKERRRMRKLLRGGRKKAGRKPTLGIETISDLELLWKKKAISKPYYYRKRKELLG